jgi:dTDP-4-dehydrorhamnose 3,5-epimerase
LAAELGKNIAAIEGRNEMKITPTDIADLVVIEPRVFEDNRGFFFESYNKKTWSDLGLKYDFVQDNVSWSRKGVLRGLHLQRGAAGQAKLVSVLQGAVLDVAVDLRLGSPTFKKHVAIELSAENKKQFMIPRGFAHGFIVLSETAVFSYKCDNGYDPKAEVGILYNDPDLAINWGMPESTFILNDKDRKNSPLKDVLKDLT